MSDAEVRSALEVLDRKIAQAREIAELAQDAADGLRGKPTANANRLQGRRISSVSLTAGQVYSWNETIKKLEPVAVIGILDRNTDTVDVANTTDETSIYSHEIGAGVLGTTGGARLSVGGNYLNDSGAPTTLQIKVKLGATTVLTSNLAAIVQSSLWRKWTLDIWFLNLAANNQHWHAKFFMSYASADNFHIVRTTDASPSVVGIGYNNSSEDTSAARTIDVTVKHGNAHADLQISKYTALLEFIPAT